MTAYETDIGTSTVRSMQFENANEGRSYPLADNAVARAASGQTLPDGFLTDARIVVPDGTEPFLSSACLTAYLVSVCVKVMNGASVVGALSVTVSRPDLSPYVPYRLEPLSGTEDAGGIVTFGDLSGLDASGVFRFSDRQVPFSRAAYACFRPSGLRRIVDPRTGESVSGDVSVSFPNYVLASRTVLPSGEEAVRLSLAEGAGKVLASSCAKQKPENACGSTPVTSVSGVRPDSLGRIVLRFM